VCIGRCTLHLRGEVIPKFKFIAIRKGLPLDNGSHPFSTAYTKFHILGNLNYCIRHTEVDRSLAVSICYNLLNKPKKQNKTTLILYKNGAARFGESFICLLSSNVLVLDFFLTLL
jgi:hypothetical protein